MVECTVDSNTICCDVLCGIESFRCIFLCSQLKYVNLSFSISTLLME